MSTLLPVQEPVSLDFAKAFLRVDTDAEDALILALITGARCVIETRTGRSLADMPDVPMPLQQAILLMMAHNFEHRDGATRPPEPIFIDALIEPYRAVHL